MRGFLGEKTLDGGLKTIERNLCVLCSLSCLSLYTVDVLCAGTMLAFVRRDGPARLEGHMGGRPATERYIYVCVCCALRLFFFPFPTAAAALPLVLWANSLSQNSDAIKPSLFFTSSFFFFFSFFSFHLILIFSFFSSFFFFHSA